MKNRRQVEGGTREEKGTKSGKSRSVSDSELLFDGKILYDPISLLLPAFSGASSYCFPHSIILTHYDHFSWKENDRERETEKEKRPSRMFSLWTRLVPRSINVRMSPEEKEEERVYYVSACQLV